MNTDTPPSETVQTGKLPHRQTRKVVTTRVVQPVTVGIDEAAAMLGVSSRTIQRLDAAGHFPNAIGGKGHGTGMGRRLIPASDIQAHLNRHRKQSA